MYGFVTGDRDVKVVSLFVDTRMEAYHRIHASEGKPF